MAGCISGTDSSNCDAGLHVTSRALAVDSINRNRCIHVCVYVYMLDGSLGTACQQCEQLQRHAARPGLALPLLSSLSQSITAVPQMPLSDRLSTSGGSSVHPLSHCRAQGLSPASVSGQSPPRVANSFVFGVFWVLQHIHAVPSLACWSRSSATAPPSRLTLSHLITQWGRSHDKRPLVESSAYTVNQGA